MKITKELDGKTLTLAVEGRLDTSTAPEFENELKDSLDSAEKLILDFAKLDYISSAGLRVLLAAQKKMAAKSGMVVKNVNKVVYEVFAITGFTDILVIER